MFKLRTDGIRRLVTGYWRYVLIQGEKQATGSQKQIAIVLFGGITLKYAQQAG